MKKIVSAGLMLATMSGAAFAADLPARTAPPVYTPPPIPVFTWTGAYFGINAGYAFDNEARFRNLNGTGAATGIGAGRPAALNLNSDGFTGGGQIGYNYQLGGLGGFGGGGLGGIVVGVEADAAYTDLTRSRVVVGTNGFSNRFRSSLDYLGTVRGRLGFAIGQALVYGTGGLAYGGLYDGVTFFNGAGGARYFGKRDGMATGYTVGGGIEYALPTNSFLNFFKSSAVTLKAEYLYYDLGKRTFALPAVTGGGGSGSYFTRVSNDGSIARVGLNYKFGSY